MTAVYMGLRKGQISSEDLLFTLNSINPLIQITMEYSKDQMPVLDILTETNENNIWMDLYYKPMDILRYLTFTFSHPNHFKQNIPRLCTNVENNA